MDPFLPSSSSVGSSSPPSTEALMEQVKLQLAQAHAEESLKVYHLYLNLPPLYVFPLIHCHTVTLSIQLFVLKLSKHLFLSRTNLKTSLECTITSWLNEKEKKNLIWVSTL